MIRDQWSRQHRDESSMHHEYRNGYFTGEVPARIAIPGTPMPERERAARGKEIRDFLSLVIDTTCQSESQ